MGFDQHLVAHQGEGMADRVAQRLAAGEVVGFCRALGRQVLRPGAVARVNQTLIMRVEEAWPWQMQLAELSPPNIT